MKGKNKALNNNQLRAMKIFKERVTQIYDISSVIIFGSTARGEAEEGSDLDVLLVTKKQLTHREKHAVYRISTEINWEFDTNISVTIVDEYNWEHGLYSIMLIKEEVHKDGVVI
jgi:predicted nucleotidyltransferase